MSLICYSFLSADSSKFTNFLIWLNFLKKIVYFWFVITPDLTVKYRRQHGANIINWYCCTCNILLLASSFAPRIPLGLWLDPAGGLRAPPQILSGAPEVIALRSLLLVSSPSKKCPNKSYKLHICHLWVPNYISICDNIWKKIKK